MFFIILQIIIFQLIMAVVVILTLRFILNRKVIEFALQTFDGYRKPDEAPIPKEVIVISHKNLNPARQQRILQIAQKKFGPNVKVNFLTDKSFMGGLVIKFNHVQIGSSVRDRLKEGGLIK